MKKKVETGRVAAVPRRDRADYCKSCEVRILYGDPRSNDSWESALELDRSQTNLILVAAAEFEELYDEAVADALAGGTPIPEFPTAVDFVDWLTPSALPKPLPYYKDGAPIAKTRNGHHHPDPIPYHSRRTG